MPLPSSPSSLRGRNRSIVVDESVQPQPLPSSPSTSPLTRSPQQKSHRPLGRRAARLRGMVVIGFLLAAATGCLLLALGLVANHRELILQEQGDGAEASHPPSSAGERIRSSKSRTKRADPPVAPTLAAETKVQKSEGERAMIGGEGGVDKCSFRKYPPNRYYGLSSKDRPKFLADAAYIRGKWPTILDVPENGLRKVCIDTSSWEKLEENRWPFTDGHNPSVVSLASNPYAKGGGDGETHVRLDPSYLKPLSSAFPHLTTESLYLGISIFGNGQCKWNMSPAELESSRFSLHDAPPNGKKTVVAALDPTTFETLWQTTMLLERDAKYGTTRKALKVQKQNGAGSATSSFARIEQEFDDPRLFFHGGRLWVLYRNGPLFGYNDQIHNPVHFELGGDGEHPSIVAYVKSSETITVCCGRNIALISEEMGPGAKWVENPVLKALTWVDPVTVVDVPAANGIAAAGEGMQKRSRRRLLEVGTAINEGISAVRSAANATDSAADYYSSGAQMRRRLGGGRGGGGKKKSNIHGTNGYMVPLPSTGELLGVAHFHRPEHREKSDFALHGHHYSHAFFTIARKKDAEKDGRGGNASYRLKRLSNEFVFRSPSAEGDADVIQFASGLDIVGSDDASGNGKLVVSYGINDCEGAALTLPMEQVQQMLLDVAPGQEVADVMEMISE